MYVNLYSIDAISPPPPTHTHTHTHTASASNQTDGSEEESGGESGAEVVVIKPLTVVSQVPEVSCVVGLEMTIIVISLWLS